MPKSREVIAEREAQIEQVLNKFVANHGYSFSAGYFSGVIKVLASDKLSERSFRLLVEQLQPYAEERA